MGDTPYDTPEERLAIASDYGCSNQMAIACGNKTSSLLAQTEINCKEKLIQCVNCLSNNWEGCLEEKQSVVETCKGIINSCKETETTFVQTSTEGSQFTTPTLLQEVKETSVIHAKELSSKLFDQTTRGVTSYIYETQKETETDDLSTIPTMPPTTSTMAVTNGNDDGNVWLHWENYINPPTMTTIVGVVLLLLIVCWLLFIVYKNTSRKNHGKNEEDPEKGIQMNGIRT